MEKKTLKYLIAAVAALMLCAKIVACPTCVGRLMLGVKKPFFELYRPKAINRRRRKRIWMAFKKEMVEKKEQKTKTKKNKIKKG